MAPTCLSRRAIAIPFGRTTSFRHPRGVSGDKIVFFFYASSKLSQACTSPLLVLAPRGPSDCSRPPGRPSSPSLYCRYTLRSPWSGPGGAELDDAYASDKSIGFVLILKKSSISFSNLQTPASPTQLSRLWVCAPYRRFSCTSKLEEPRERSLMMKRMRRFPEGVSYCHIFVRCVTGIRRVNVSVQYIKTKV